MGFMHIDNLYKNQEILMFKECYALEKIHGSSAHISWNGDIKFFAGGTSHSEFIKIFDAEKLLEKFYGMEKITVFGEAYGGKCQGMGKTYGEKLKFVVFDVCINDLWLSVPQADDFAKDLGLEFVEYERIMTSLEEIDRCRDKCSAQAMRNGCGKKDREGVVLRPIMELRKNNGERIICKHKRDTYRETKTERKVSPEKLKVLNDAKEIAEEWVTTHRIQHVLSKISDVRMENMKNIICAMCEDIKREGEGEIVWSKQVEKAIGKATAIGVKQYFKNKLKECN